MLRARVGSVITFVVMVAQGALARADETGSAAALFQDGLQAMKATRYAEACPKLAESYWLDPRPGVLFTLAECEAKWGRVASALAHYDDYLRLYASMPAGLQAVQRERADVAQRQRAALVDRVPTLTLVVPASAPAGVVVRRDGVTLGAPSLGAALPVDPGAHVIVVEIPSGATTTREISLELGERLRLELEMPAAKAERAPVEPPAPPPTQAAAPRAAIALLAVGAAGLVVGGTTGGLALAGKSTIEAHCTGTICDLDGKQAADRAKRLGWVSTVAFGAGAASIATGALLWLVGSRHVAGVGIVHPGVWSTGDATVVGISGRL